MHFSEGLLGGKDEKDLSLWLHGTLKNLEVDIDPKKTKARALVRNVWEDSGGKMEGCRGM